MGLSLVFHWLSFVRRDTWVVLRLFLRRPLLLDETSMFSTAHTRMNVIEERSRVIDERSRVIEERSLWNPLLRMLSSTLQPVSPLFSPWVNLVSVILRGTTKLRMWSWRMSGKNPLGGWGEAVLRYMLQPSKEWLCSSCSKELFLSSHQTCLSF